jgi:threonine-phosphate decarboxylase
LITKYDFTDLTNPFGFHDNVKNAMEAAMNDVGNYPSIGYRSLQSKLSQYLETDEGNLVITAGAAEGIFLLPQLIRPSQTGIVQPTFNFYRPAALAVNSNIIDIVLNKDFTLPLSKILSLLPGLELLYICNPNNPTSLTYPIGQLVEIIEKAADENCFVVVDEVYLDFADNSENKTVKDLVLEYTNLAVVSSFSKILAIPGLRVGYVLTNSEIALALREMLQPWPVNIIGIKTALAAIKEEKFLNETLRKTRLAKDIFIQELKGLGIFEVFQSDANFIMVKLLEQGKGRLIQEKLIEKGMPVHLLGDYVGLNDDYIQIAVRRSADNGILIDTLNVISIEERLVA